MCPSIRPSIFTAYPTLDHKEHGACPRGLSTHSEGHHGHTHTYLYSRDNLESAYNVCLWTEGGNLEPGENMPMQHSLGDVVV